MRLTVNGTEHVWDLLPRNRREISGDRQKP